ncbi:MAG: 50S ribosomal protein L9 [Candidatus Neomarinimicrobiota bacterium]|nr:MAG: 50S ribosomal protein L9 [bacterium]|tara:strand:- start:452 stop:895 length:444 start_codon:yes stop_codon:yes gene_type:complete
MEVILLEDFEGLGASGEIVRVKPGYARNYLFPRGIALRSSKKNRAVAEERKRNKELKSKRLNKANESLANKINKIELTFEAQVGDEEKMFGAITSKDIHSALEEKGIALDKNSILLDESIKALGIYHIPIKLDSELKAELKIYVIKT